jgi:serine/threonine-protein kinase
MYMSPEQADGQRVGPASDRYSLGIVAYELLTGRPPFRAETPLALLRAHIDKPLPPPRSLNPRLPAAVEAALFKIMAKDPADRYPSGAAFVAALQAEASTQVPAPPVRTAPTRPVPHGARPAADATAEVMAGPR